MELLPISEVRQMAAATIKSGMSFGLQNQDAALALMLICQSENLHPMQAVRRFHIIKGRPAMRADAMQAEFQRAGGTVHWLERSNTCCRATFEHSSGGKLTVCWTLEDAKSAGLTSNENWRRFPRQMLAARVISEGVRAVLPAIICGMYTPEEITDSLEVPSVQSVSSVQSVQIENKKDTSNIDVVEPILNDTCPAEVVEPVDPVEPSVPTTREMQAARQKVRQLAKLYGCKTQDDFAALTKAAIGRSVVTVGTMDTQEIQTITEFLTAAISEQEGKVA